MRAEPPGIPTTQERRTGGRADRLNIVLVKFDSLGDQPVHVGCFAKSLMPADIAPPEVIGNDQEDVRLRRAITLSEQHLRDAENHQRPKHGGYEAGGIHRRPQSVP